MTETNPDKDEDPRACSGEVFSIIFFRLSHGPIKGSQIATVEGPPAPTATPVTSLFIAVLCLPFNSVIQEGVSFIHQYSCTSAEVVFGEPNRLKE
jgi:hypothetical protein